jgi:hypothetical protein
MTRNDAKDMLNTVKDNIRGSRLWREIAYPLREHRKVSQWRRAGMPPPPPHSIKVRNLITVADIFGLDVLVETGTYRGQMIDAAKDRFRKIYSIEIFGPFAEAAARRFSGWHNVEIVHGDSAAFLPQVLDQTAPPPRGILDRIYAFLEDDLLRRVLEALASEPAPMRLGPVIATGRIKSAVAQQEESSC